MADQAEQEVGTTAQPPSQSEAVTLILSLVEKVGYIVAFYFLFKSIPADKMKEVLDAATADAKKTETPVDDVLVSMGRMIADALVKAQNQASEAREATSVVQSFMRGQQAAGQPSATGVPRTINPDGSYTLEPDGSAG